MNSSVSLQDAPDLDNDIPGTDHQKTLRSAKIIEDRPDQSATAFAHEIRNPLTTINLAADMLNSTLLSDDQKTYLDMITRAAIRINTLTTNLLAYYQNDEALVENYSIHQLLDDVLELSVDRIKLKSIAVKKYYAALHPGILVNKQNMKIAMTNIIINAIDAMPSKNGELKLVTGSMNGKCVLEIKDNGVGVSKENLKNIFKPYFSSKHGGLGLGLSTTLKILRSNHVGVDVRSEVGAGTNFILLFNKIP
jgi:signal transduction histidine kinase